MWRYILMVLLLVVLQFAGLSASGAVLAGAADPGFPAAPLAALNGLLICAPAMLLLALRGSHTGLTLALCGCAALFFAVLRALYPQAPFLPSGDMLLAASVAYFAACGAHLLRKIPRYA